MEGLIKQRSAEKAVSRVVEFLRTIGEQSLPADAEDGAAEV